MKSNFHIHSFRSYRMFAIRLKKVSLATALPKFGGEYVERFPRRQSDWLGSVLGICGEGAVLDLRTISAPEPENIPEGRISVALLCKVRCMSDEAYSRALQTLRLTETLFEDEYEFEAVDSRTAFESVRPPFRIEDAVEVTRRTEIIPLDLPIGSRDRSVGFRSAAEEFGKASNRILHVFPFVRTNAESNNLFRLLLRQDHRLGISVRITKEALTANETDFIGKEISRCEQYSNATVFHNEEAGEISRREQAKSFQRSLIRSLGSLKSSAVVMQTEIVGESEVPISVVESLGRFLTMPAAYSKDHLDPTSHLSGGFVAVRPVLSSVEHSWKNPSVKLGFDESIPLEGNRLKFLFDAEEATAAFRFPLPTIEEIPGLDCKAYRTGLFASSVQNGQLIGHSKHNGHTREVRLSRRDRRRHLYAVGQTGTGKSTMFESMILDDMNNGEGLCLIDPHGDLIEKLLRKVPRKRAKDVIIFDPGDAERPFGFNILEYENEAQKSFLIQELLAIIQRLVPYEMAGPMFLHQSKMALKLVMSNPDEMGTLAQFFQVFSKDGYYKRFLPLHKPDQILQTFIDYTLSKHNYTRQSTDGGSFGNWIASKYEPFIGDPMLLNIFGQRRSSIDLGRIMGDGKILLVNLSKGRMGELNSRFFGMVLIAKLQAAVMARAKSPENERRDFYLYVDEFQNLATDNFGVLLAEARKYRLNLIITNQFITQVPNNIREAITGNVGSIISFRVGSIDAEYLERDFLPQFGRYDLMNLPNFNTYVSTLVDGQVTKPFSMRIVSDSSPARKEYADEIVEHSRTKYGRRRETVEKEIEASLASPYDEE